MNKLLKMSFINVKNIMLSRKLLIFIGAAYAYALLWMIAAPLKQPNIELFNFEFSRFFYLGVLYASASILRDDIKENTTKVIFTGIFTRIEVMISKCISLIFIGFIFYVLLEINTLLGAIIHFNKIGILGFLGADHLGMLKSCVVMTFLMGSAMLLIIAVMFNDSKVILFYITTFAMVNFFMAAVVTTVIRQPEVLKNTAIKITTMTPFYTTTALMGNSATVKDTIISVIYGVSFCLCSILVVYKREIR